MYLLTRIVLQNWYLVDALDIDVTGVTALAGPQGAGKSSLIDAIQVAISGNNRRMMEINASASGKSERTVREYCLGYLDLPGEGEPRRTDCETLVALVFTEAGSGHQLTIGVVLEAHASEEKEILLSRFIAPGYAYSSDFAIGEDAEGQFIREWEAIKKTIKAACPEFLERRNSTEAYIGDYLALMRPKSQQPDPKHFMRAFSNAIAFRAIEDATHFTRRYILEPDPLNIQEVSASIARYREIVRTVEQIITKLGQLRRVEGHFRNWGRNLVREVNNAWMAEAAGARDLGVAYREAGIQLRRFEADLAKAEAEKAAKVARLEEMRKDLATKTAMLETSDVKLRLESVEAQEQLLLSEVQRLQASLGVLAEIWRRAGRLADAAYWTPDSQRENLEAGLSLARLLAEQPSAEACLERHPKFIDDMTTSLRGLAGLDFHYGNLRDNLFLEVRDLQDEIRTLNRQIERMGEGRSPLSHDTEGLLALLAEAGIEAIPLADVVEVTDRSWQYAIEALLGRGREALIVPPERVHEAFAIMFQHRNRYSRCTLVKTNRSHEVDLDRLPDDSVARLVKSDNRHALAFIATRIGGFRRAESEAELDAMERAVMRNGKATAGLGLTVSKDLPVLILGGSGARPAEIAGVSAKLEEKRREHTEKKRDMDFLGAAAENVKRIVEDLQGAARPSDLKSEFAAAREMMTEISRQKEAIKADQDPVLAGQIEDLKAQIRRLSQEIAGPLEGRIRQIVNDRGGAHTERVSAKRAFREAVKLKRRMFRGFADAEYQRVLKLGAESEGDGGLSVVRRFRIELYHREGAGVRGSLKELRERCIGELEAARQRIVEHGNRAVRELEAFCSEWQIDNPHRDEVSLSEAFGWVQKEIGRLENNELLVYQEDARKAEEEMQHTFKEQLLTKLAEKFKFVDHQLTRLTRALGEFDFRGEVYGFKKEVSDRFKNLHRLATKVADNPEQGHAIIAGKLEDHEAQLVKEAMAELEQLIEGGGDLRELEDYRNYFEYDLAIKKASGVRTSMHTRTVKGSGGESQLPFYIAIAASLSLSYFPGSQGLVNEGMGLVVFDEAFNKMDVTTTRKVFDFFHRLGLQLLVASAEDKVATFLEVADTMVMVNRSADQKSVRIDSEIIGERARKEFAAANPDHLGLDGFRRIAEEAAGGARAIENAVDEETEAAE